MRSIAWKAFLWARKREIKNKHALIGANTVNICHHRLSQTPFTHRQNSRMSRKAHLFGTNPEASISPHYFKFVIGTHGCNHRKNCRFLPNLPLIRVYSKRKPRKSRVVGVVPWLYRRGSVQFQAPRSTAASRLQISGTIRSKNDLLG